MALTQVKTDGINADSVTAAKIADDAVGAEHIEQLDSDLSFADNAKAKFGAGNDLQIDHSGTNSQIYHDGTGHLYIATQGSGEDLVIQAKNEFKVSTADSERVHVTSAGRLDVKSGDLAVTGAEGGDAQLRLTADEGDDGADYWRLESKASNNNFNLATYASGSWVDKLSMNTDGHLMLGTSTKGNHNVDDFTIASSGNTGITIRSGTTSNGAIAFADGTSGSSEYMGYIDYDHNTDKMTFTANDTLAMSIDSSAKVGIGTSSPDLPLHVEGTNNADLYKALRITNGGGQAGTLVAMEFECGVDEVATISANNAGSDIGNLMFATARSTGAYPAEAMRIDSDGALLVGQTSKQYSDLRFAVTGSNQNLVYFDCAGNGNNYALTIKHGYAYSGSNGIALRFLNSGGTQVGRIDVGQSTTAYVTSSDYRLKENAEAISDGITRLKTLKPYRFNWKEEKGQPKVDGFFAHEVTAVPEAVRGTKDEVDSDKKPVYQGIDQSKLVPLLTAALQEAIAKIEVLETKVAALEAA